jgi:hypothetical protein
MIYDPTVFGSDTLEDLILHNERNKKLYEQSLAIDYMDGESIHPVLYWYHYNAKIELEQVERVLRNLYYWYGRSEKLYTNMDWELKVENAKNAQIGDVIQRYMKIKDFRRNVCCPFHKEKSPSMSICTKRNIFKCFGCGVGGDPITFVQLWEKCDFKEAVNYLN